MTSYSNFVIVGILMNIVSGVLGNSNHPRQLEKIGGDEVFRRKIDDVEDMYGSHDETTKASTKQNILDPLGGGNILRRMLPLSETDRSILSNLASSDYLRNAERYRVDFLDILDRLTGGELSRSLDNIEIDDILLALEDAMREDNSNRHKRGMDSLLGETFGEMKRYIPMKALAKRNFDEIDNVGFNNWAKRPYTPKKDKKAIPRMHALALARRGFGNSRRYHVNSLAKRNFDEIDRTGFETFSKRETK